MGPESQVMKYASLLHLGPFVMSSPGPPGLVIASLFEPGSHIAKEHLELMTPWLSLPESYEYRQAPGLHISHPGLRDGGY